MCPIWTTESHLSCRHKVNRPPHPNHPPQKKNPMVFCSFLPLPNQVVTLKCLCLVFTLPPRVVSFLKKLTKAYKSFFDKPHLQSSFNFSIIIKDNLSLSLSLSLSKAKKIDFTQSTPYVISPNLLQAVHKATIFTYRPQPAK